jgi:hypothetical protein
MMLGAITGKIAATLLSYWPRDISTRWRACLMSRLRVIATRATVGKSMANNR